MTARSRRGIPHLFHQENASTPRREPAATFMKIGIDFDNTIVCYDDLFWTLGHERGVINESVARRKEAVRDTLRQSGRESIWTEMQGEAYGTRMADADLFDGVLEALADFRQRGWSVCVISHKTRFPFAGPSCDLHLAARNWCQSNRLLDVSKTGLDHDRLYFELTKEDKLRRIAVEKCDVFIDDLPELLRLPEFPSGVQKILFDPHATSLACPFVRMSSWKDAVDLIVRNPRS